MVEGILTHLYLIPKLMPFITSYPNVPFMLHKRQHLKTLSQSSAGSEPILSIRSRWGRRRRRGAEGSAVALQQREAPQSHTDGFGRMQFCMRIF